MNGLLSLVQWLSPSFPVGGYAYSHGLETGIASGEISGADDVAAWLRDILRLGAGRADAMLLAAVLRGEVAETVAAEARALAASRERWDETMKQGAAFAAAVEAATGQASDTHPLPVSVGVAARRLDLPAEQVIGIYLHAFASNLVNAAVRFVPLGQGEGQRLLARLHPDIEEIARAAVEAPVAGITSFVPGADLMAMEHEILDVRIFKS